MSSQPSYEAEALPVKERGLVQTGLIRFLSFFISAYQYLLSPLLGNRCRFTPGCSSYMKEALHRHGVFRGLYLGTRRLCSCHPFHEGGLDPVPQTFSFNKQKK